MMHSYQAPDFSHTNVFMQKYFLYRITKIMQWNKANISVKFLLISKKNRKVGNYDDGPDLCISLSLSDMQTLRKSTLSISQLMKNDPKKQNCSPHATKVKFILKCAFLAKYTYSHKQTSTTSISTDKIIWKFLITMVHQTIPLTHFTNTFFLEDALF